MNHVISKEIVSVAQRTGRGMAVEELGGVRDRCGLAGPADLVAGVNVRDRARSAWVFVTMPVAPEPAPA